MKVTPLVSCFINSVLTEIKWTNPFQKPMVPVQQFNFLLESQPACLSQIMTWSAASFVRTLFSYCGSRFISVASPNVHVRRRYFQNVDRPSVNRDINEETLPILAMYCFQRWHLWRITEAQTFLRKVKTSNVGILLLLLPTCGTIMSREGMTRASGVSPLELAMRRGSKRRDSVVVLVIVIVTLIEL